MTLLAPSVPQMVAHQARRWKGSARRVRYCEMAAVLCAHSSGRNDRVVTGE
jgi:hypothetical protein